MSPPAHPVRNALPGRWFAQPVGHFRVSAVAAACRIEGNWERLRKGQYPARGRKVRPASASLYELNAHLAIGAPRHAAAPPEPEGELLRNLLHADRELGAPDGDVADDAAHQWRTIAGIDLRQILQIVTAALAAFVEVMRPKQRHGMLAVGELRAPR